MASSVPHLCEEHREIHDTINTLKFQMDIVVSSVNEMKTAMMGTPNIKGLVTEVKEHTEYIKSQKNNVGTLINWCYKIMVTSMLYWIALKMYGVQLHG